MTIIWLPGLGLILRDDFLTHRHPIHTRRRHVTVSVYSARLKFENWRIQGLLWAKVSKDVTGGGLPRSSRTFYRDTTNWKDRGISAVMKFATRNNAHQRFRGPATSLYKDGIALFIVKKNHLNWWSNQAEVLQKIDYTSVIRSAQSSRLVRTNGTSEWSDMLQRRF